MKLDNPLHQLRYFLQDDMYLLKADRQSYRHAETQPAASTDNTPTATFNADPVTQQTPATTFKYLGGNQKNFLILGSYPNGQFIAETHLAALMSTITRLNFSQDDVAILNLNEYPDANWPQVSAFFKPAKLLVLGAAAWPAGLSQILQNQVEHINGCQTLYTFSFNEMMGNKENTKTFWNQIKTF